MRLFATRSISFQVVKYSKSASMFSKTSQTSGLKDFQGLILLNISGASGTVISKMGICLLMVSIFKGTQRFQVFHGMGDLSRELKTQRFTVPGQKFSKFLRVLKGLKSSQGPQGAKGLILECLHLSIHLCTAFYS